MRTPQRLALPMFYRCPTEAHEVLRHQSNLNSGEAHAHVQQVRLIGGGGTKIGVGITAAARHFPRPDLIIVITDGDTDWPKRGPRGIPVVCVMVSANQTAPRWIHKVIQVPLR
ncbi:MAG: hypothetical protein KDD69_04240 [Bdellovibrionales bacterium]|nr:hypothetical protein [Bdellovibrionales bacterium]